MSASGEITTDSVTGRPPRLNERVFVRSYDPDELSAMKGFRNHCETISKCGLVPEVVAETGRRLQLYAARRRGRNGHD